MRLKYSCTTYRPSFGSDCISINQSPSYTRKLNITIHLQSCILRPLHPELDFVIYKNAPNLSIRPTKQSLINRIV